MDACTRLRHHTYEHDNTFRNVHILHVLRPHSPRPYDRQARLPRRASLAADEDALQGRLDLLRDRVRLTLFSRNYD